MTVTIEYAKEVLSYDPETGEFRWKERPRHHFKTAKGWRIFNTRYANQRPGVVEKGYIRFNFDGCSYRAHRMAWFLVNEQEPLGEIDHINGDRTDNRISNLRVVSSWQNSRNKKRPKHNTSGRIGVSWREDLGRWSACIGVGGGKSKSLGFYDTIEEASAARVGAEVVLGYHKNHGRD